MSKFINITTERDLREYFQNETLYLSKKSNLKIEPYITLENNIKFSGINIIRSGTKVNSNSSIINCNIGRNNHIRENSLIVDTKIDINNILGPYCFLRNSIIKKNNIVGTFVEMARSSLNTNNKISHRAYIGDTKVFSNVIIGAGVTTCNYKNGKKLKCTIQSGTLIGSGSQIIAELKIGRNCIIGAGSVINKNLRDGTKIIQKRNNDITIFKKKIIK
tara:strand:- start:372 stop:1025 length:654 start_codon:yes stop_codon:yes gene_type:complete